MKPAGLRRPFLLVCLVFVGLVLSLALVGCGDDGDSTETTAASQETFTLRLATGEPEGEGPVSRDYKAWVADIESASNGRLKIEIYWGGTLGDVKDSLGLLTSGTADMILAGYAQLGDKLPVSDVVSLPYLVTDPMVAGTLMGSLMADGLLPEYDQMKVIMFRPQDPIMMFFRDKEVTSLEDMKGLKIRVNSPNFATFVETLGGVPTNIVHTELFQALQTGVVDGCITSPGFFYPNGLAETCKYVLVEPIASPLNFVGVSLEVWNRLPADLQLVLVEQTDRWVWLNSYRETERLWTEYLNPLEEAGMELIYLSPEEHARWVEATASMADEWAAGLDAKGLAGSEAVRRARILSGN